MLKDEDCPLCDSSSAILANELAYVLEDSDPVTPGHCLVVPARHVADFFELTLAEQEAILDLVRQAKSRLDGRYHPDGYNVGVNVGEAAGQSVAHAHVHVIPRRRGDMPDPSGGVRGVIPREQKH